MLRDEARNLTDDIWSILMEDIQDGDLSVGDCYRMKSHLFQEIKKLSSLVDKKGEK